MAKRELKVTLETVTPMFMAGIVQNQPELRPPSILGPLRYWLRVALGGVVGNNLNVLKRAEAEVFGDTKGTGAVQIRRVRWVGNPPKPVRKNALPHPSARPAKMLGFPADKKFELIMTQHVDNQATWLAAISALLLMVSIGGLGRRCRRGWGTVKITGADLSHANLVSGWHPLFSKMPKTSTGWINHIKTVDQVGKIGIKPLLADFGIANPEKVSRQKYTALSSDLMGFLISTSYQTPKQAISDFGENEHKALKNKSLPEKSVGSALGGRQASPLWLRVLPVNGRNNQTHYIMLATLFDVDFKGANYKAVRRFLKSANFKEVK